MNPHKSQSETAVVKAGSKRQITLSTLLLLVTGIALMLAWWVDRSALKAQIPEQPTLITYSYAIQNGSAVELATVLQEFFEGELVTIQPFAGNNSLIVNAEKKKQRQIRVMLKHLDRDCVE